MSASYINIIYAAIPIQLLFETFNALSRSVGDSKKPLHFLIISVTINLILDVLFVKCFGWGVIGAAAATVIAQLFATVAAGIYIFKYNKEFTIKIENLKPDFKIALEQIKLGIPISLQYTVTSIGSMVLQNTINGFGSKVIAGFTAAGRIEQITNIPMSNLCVAAMTFVSQNYGAGNYNRIVKNVRKIFSWI